MNFSYKSIVKSFNFEEPLDFQISIIIPVHNAENFIDQTLEALFKRPLMYTELVFIFDNCTDHSRVKVEHFLSEKSFGSVRIIETSSGSTSKSRNIGIDNARGKYIAFLDHDDIVDSAMYIRLLRYAKSIPEVDVVRCGFSTNPHRGVYEYNETLPGRKAYPFRGIFIWNGIFRRDFLNFHKIRFFEGYGEDYEFNLDLLVHDAIEGRIEEESVYYHWRQHGDNLHNRRTSDAFIARIDGMLTRKARFLEKNSEISSQMASWVIDYIEYLSMGHHLSEISSAYISNDRVRGFLNSGHQALIENKALREMIKSSSIGEFLNAAKELNKPVAMAKTHPVSYYSRIKYNIHRLRSVWTNTGGGVTFFAYAVNRFGPQFLSNYLFDKYKTNISHIIGIEPLARETVQERINYLQACAKPKALFFVFRQEFISGGLISIYSIAEKFRANGIEPIMVAAPGATVSRNRLFPNQELSIPWECFILNKWDNIQYIMLPEVKAIEFSDLLEKHDISYPDAVLNLLNQNNELMPLPSTLKCLKRRFKATTMTTAHLRYTTQEISDQYDVPVTHLSTYMSFRDYIVKPFSEKRDLILYSVDAHPLKSRIMRTLERFAPSYEHKIIQGLGYAEYLKLVHAAKFGISFGEGLDNYFIEPIFTGGMGITVFNPEFMPEKFLKLDNVFSSYPEMEREAATLIDDLINDDSYRFRLWTKNFEILSQLYDDRIYDAKILKYLNGDRDFVPISIKEAG